MNNTVYATGRRKSAVARVFLSPGTGKRTINGIDAAQYLTTESLVQKMETPLALLENSSKYDVRATTKGGGIGGQAEAIQLGIARCLAEESPENRAALKAEGLLTRDARVKERKKYGQAGARKQFQFSKR
ncbi:30S ribosomal protein S9 [Chitinivibrio alkaliphilus]|uniref:Small ribosomal subunit protein uS9 n=1 Tax=Chitinivibrio alkaliphilus ACht1 TaxID=1313304 RepID=U7D941_9BACT|nr:30S ribosomal protein S9 [Chitinivibrio alkaliphilus]ERP30915.1 30S ribosomal protein S9 [Chitinivibrio alkaliphilus ACht1]